MRVEKSKYIDSPDCEVCANRRPWESTLAKLEANLRAHGVTWPQFVIMHGRNKSCAEARSGVHDRGLYVVATNADGTENKHADIFARKNPYFVGVSAILTDRAF